MDLVAEGLIYHFATLSDPRVQKRSKHKLIDIIVIAVCGVICGAEGWEEIEVFGEAKQDWFKTFLELLNGIPSHDTIARVFSILDPIAFERCFCQWAQTMKAHLGDNLVAIDGKTVGRSFNTATGKKAIHLVSAWAVENEIVLGQIKVDDKSNEITAVPKLIEMLNLKGTTITTDAMSCQKDIAQKIIDAGGDYVLCIKANQGETYKEIKDFFTDCQRNNFKEVTYDYFESTDKGHGRIEIRKYWQSSDIDWMEEKGSWKGLKTIGMVVASRMIGEKETQESRFFLSTHLCNAERFARAVRGHWQIENGLHWCLDVALNEDGSRIRAGNAAENFSVLRRIALNLLKSEKTKKRGIKSKSKLACWDNAYLLKVLLG